MRRRDYEGGWAGWRLQPPPLAVQEFQRNTQHSSPQPGVAIDSKGNLFGVALMFVSAVVIERNARLLGRASWQDITRTPQGDDAHANLGPRTRSLRDWLSRQRHKSE